MIHIVGKSINNTIFDNKKFNDDRKLNPFNFKTYGINFFSLYVDDMQIPSRQIQPNLSAEHWNLVKHGSLRLEMRFEKDLSVTINCIVYAELASMPFDNVLKIDSLRQVIVNFSG